MSAGMPGRPDLREYSLASGPGDDYLELLVRRIPSGLISNALGTLEAGDRVRVEGPFAGLSLPPRLPPGGAVLVATGTGLAPFRSMARHCPGIGLRIILGIRHAAESVLVRDLPPGMATLCISGESGPGYRGRVTRYLDDHIPDPEALWLLAGNSDMIYDVFGILRDAGVDRSHIQAQVFF